MNSADSTSSSPSRPVGRATLKDWLAIPEEERAELIDGEIVYQSMPGPRHGRSQGRIFSRLTDVFDRNAGEGGLPGGWWISLEVDMHIGTLGCRPDVVGWRRDRHPELPEPKKDGLVTEVPDWICEVLSTSTAYLDQGRKRTAYHTAGVEHYWLLDPNYKTLTVLARERRDYVMALVAGPAEIIRAEPFDAIEINTVDLFRR